MNRHIIILVFILSVVGWSCGEKSQTDNKTTNWELRPFKKANEVNPVLLPIETSIFYCPVREDTVFWESKDVFNPAAIVKDDTLFLLYRAEDKVGKFAGTSRIGLAYSFDGTTFVRFPEPVFYPDNDEFVDYEWEGGAEDPRVVQTEDGTFVMTYSAYDGEYSRLCVAHSKDLRSWTKYGPVFTNAHGGQYLNHWSKSGSIVCEVRGDELIASKVNGKYWMYWGDTDLFMASSDDLINWVPLQAEDGGLLKVLSPRDSMFDSRLVEPGPPALITRHGILLLYNGMNLDTGGDPELAAGNYAAGQALFDITDPSKLLARSHKNFLTPDQEYEITGQIKNVCFIEGLAHYKNQWFLYYGTADSKIAVAVANP